jgi:hypothetical protein
MKSNKVNKEYTVGKMDIARRPSLPATAGVARQWRQHALSSDPRLFSSDTGGCARTPLSIYRFSAFLRPITSKELRRLAVAELGDALLPALR